MSKQPPKVPRALGSRGKDRIKKRGELRVKRSQPKAAPPPAAVTPSDTAGGVRLVLEVKNGVVRRVVTDVRTRAELFVANFDSGGMFTRGRRCEISQYEAVLDAAAVSEIAILFADASRRLSAEQMTALRRWRATHGRVWRSKLLDAWSRAGTGVPGYSPELEQLRNGFGPEWLMKQR